MKGLLATLAVTGGLAAMTASSAAAGLPAFDDVWNFDDVPATEQRFREIRERAVAGNATGYLLELDTQIARTLGLQGEFDEAASLLDEVDARLASEHVDARIRSQLERGRVLRSSGDPGASRPHFLSAWAIARDHGRDALAMDAAHMRALVEPNDRKAEWNRKALELGSASSDPRARRWLGSIYHNMGMDQLDAGELDAALETFETALAVREEVGEPEPISIARWMIAHTLRKMGRVDEALTILRDLEAAADDPDGFTLEEIAECLLAEGDAEAARPYFARAHEKLSQVPWVRESDPQRLERLERLGS